MSKRARLYNHRYGPSFVRKVSENFCGVSDGVHLEHTTIDNAYSRKFEPRDSERVRDAVAR